MSIYEDSVACWLCFHVAIILRKQKFHSNLLLICYQIEATAMPEDYRHKKVLTHHPCSYLTIWCYISLLHKFQWFMNFINVHAETLSTFSGLIIIVFGLCIACGLHSSSKYICMHKHYAFLKNIEKERCKEGVITEKATPCFSMFKSLKT